MADILLLAADVGVGNGLDSCFVCRNQGEVFGEVLIAHRKTNLCSKQLLAVGCQRQERCFAVLLNVSLQFSVRTLHASHHGSGAKEEY